MVGRFDAPTDLADNVEGRGVVKYISTQQLFP